MSVCLLFLCFFKQRTAYDWRISGWSSDVCSCDLTLGIDEGKIVESAVQAATVEVERAAHQDAADLFHVGGGDGEAEEPFMCIMVVEAVPAAVLIPPVDGQELVMVADAQGQAHADESGKGQFQNKG